MSQENMTEIEAQIKYKRLNEEVRELHLQAARKEIERDTFLKEFQKICSHDFFDRESVYGYRLCRQCRKCKYETEA